LVENVPLLFLHAAGAPPAQRHFLLFNFDFLLITVSILGSRLSLLLFLIFNFDFLLYTLK